MWPDIYEGDSDHVGDSDQTLLELFDIIGRLPDGRRGTPEMWIRRVKEHAGAEFMTIFIQQLGEYPYTLHMERKVEH